MLVICLTFVTGCKTSYTFNETEFNNLYNNSKNIVDKYLKYTNADETLTKRDKNTEETKCKYLIGIFEDKLNNGK
jgi:hypothetical protein